MAFGWCVKRINIIGIIRFPPPNNQPTSIKRAEWLMTYIVFILYVFQCPTENINIARLTKNNASFEWDVDQQ
jgi:hypothetical protein